MADVSAFASAPLGGANIPATVGPRVDTFANVDLLGAQPQAQQLPTQPVPDAGINVGVDLADLATPQGSTTFQDRSTQPLNLSPGQRVGLQAVSSIADVFQQSSNLKFQESEAMRRIMIQSASKQTLERLRRVDNETTAARNNIRSLRQLREQASRFGLSGQQTQLRLTDPVSGRQT